MIDVGDYVVIDATTWANGGLPIKLSKNGLLKHVNHDTIAVYRVVNCVTMDSGQVMCELNSGLWSSIDHLILVHLHKDRK